MAGSYNARSDFVATDSFIKANSLTRKGNQHGSFSVSKLADQSSEGPAGTGVALALPFLDCMGRSAAAENDAQPRRSVFIYLPNGVNTNDYEIAKAGKNYEISRILKPLENIGKTSRRSADFITPTPLASLIRRHKRGLPAPGTGPLTGTRSRLINSSPA